MATHPEPVASDEVLGLEAEERATGSVHERDAPLVVESDDHRTDDVEQVLPSL